MSKRLVLASTSPYRRQLLARLGLPFDCEAPGVEELHLPGESPADRSLRLARLKARAVAARRPDAVVIGSDQVASCASDAGVVVLDKPGNRARWTAQLEMLSGRVATFHTAVAVVAPGGESTHTDLTHVVFRRFDAAEAARYQAMEPALDCAGGFKAEGAGVALMSRLESQDPTAIIGLPLIWLCDALRAAGFAIP